MKKDRYFLVMSVILLLVTIIGFIPSFLLRPVFKDTPLPYYFIIHGCLLFLWFAAYFHQSLLVFRGRVVNHRRNGRYWFMLALLVEFANLYVLYAISQETAEGTVTYWKGVRTPESAGLLLLGTGYLVLTSSILLIIAYVKRNRIQIHKRAVFGASIILLTPAFDRFLRPFQVDEIHPLVKVLMINIFPVSLLIYDIAKRKKPYRITIFIVLLILLTLPIVFGLSNAGIGSAIVKFLGQ